MMIAFRIGFTALAFAKRVSKARGRSVTVNVRYRFD